MADSYQPKLGAQAQNPAFTNAGAKKDQQYRWNLHTQPSISSVATWEWDIANGVCRYSPEWAEIVGSRPDEGDNTYNWSWWSGHMHMDEMPMVLDIHRHFFQGEYEEAEIVHRLRRPDGRWIRLLSRGAVSKWNEDGTPAIMSGLSLDISHLDLQPPLPDTAASVQSGRAYCGKEISPAQQFALERNSFMILHQFTHMERASIDELMHYTLTSIAQLTDSPNCLLFFPSESDFYTGHLLYAHPQGKQHGLFPKESLPEVLATLIDDPTSYTEGRIVNGDGQTPVFVLDKTNTPLMRYLLVPILEEGRVVCLAGVSNKAQPYTESDLQQVQTVLNNAWLILRRHLHIQELKQAKETAEAANKAKNEFLANISHEMRTPLNGLLSMLQLLEDFPMQEPQREFLETARLSGNSLKYIISDILDFARIESGKLQLTLAPFDFKSTILSSLRLFHKEAEEKKLTFSTTIDPDIPDILIGDVTRIRQILFNLLGNSLKFTHTGGIGAACSLLPSDNPEIVRIMLRVYDTGIGIPPDKQGQLFQAFTQVESFYTKTQPGTGLGLSIVKRLVAMMHGDVSLESEPGKGTTVSCVLELAQAKASSLLHGVSGKRKAASPERPLDILIAEDDAVGRFALRVFLERMGHRVVAVNNGMEALEALRLYPFHCLFTDIQMPEMDGLTLARRIRDNKADSIVPSENVRALVRRVFPHTENTLRNIDPALAIIAVSAHTMAGDKERFLQQGVHFFIGKPIAREQLDLALEAVAKQMD
ncbi:response regulator [Desulfovibrio sp. OttesenSCG-928-G15]|nr:response regulator [Desulfovibrio sp. OttesenSCG-928-G15]